jgi:hypothetical protein
MTTIFQRVDSLDYKRDQAENPSQHIVRISWQVDGGPVRSGEVDLTVAHLVQYAVPIEELLDASEPIQGQTLPTTGPPSARSGKKRAVARYPDGSVNMAEGKRYRKGQRKWVDDNGIRALPLGEGMPIPDRPAYITPSGNISWPKWVDRAYEQYLETGDYTLPKSMTEVRETETRMRNTSIRANFAARKGSVSE